MVKITMRSMLGKVIVSGETGRKFGVVGDLIFVGGSGELMNIIVSNPTAQINDLGLTEDERGRKLIPFTAVKSVGEFVIISEKDIA